MPATPKPPDKDFQDCFAQVIQHTQAALDIQHPSHPPTMLEAMFKDMCALGCDADAIARHWTSSGRVDVMDVILFATAHSASAFVAFKQGQRQLAWSYLSTAAMYAGEAFMCSRLGQELPKLVQRSQHKLLDRARSKGGQTTNGPWKAIEDEAGKIIRRRGELGERWTMERKMANSVQAELLPIARRIKPDFTEANFARTLGNRLKHRHDDIGKYLAKRGASR